MKKGKKALAIIICILAAIAIAIMGIYTAMLSRKTSIEAKSVNMDTASKKLAIIADGSQYKLELIDKLLYQSESDIGIDIFGLEDAKDAGPAGYDLVVVTAPVYIGKLQLNAKSYVAKYSDADNIFVIVTCEGENDIGLDVDSVSMATSLQFSDEAKVPQLSVDEVYDMIMERLN